MLKTTILWSFLTITTFQLKHYMERIHKRYRNGLILGIILATFFLWNTTYSQNAQITGELKEFHKVTLTWDALQTGENISTYQDYRLNVTFSSPSGQTYVVPGYFAADGNAAETSATSGNKWRCHFTATEQGTWQYSVSFRTGPNIATSFNATEGSPIASINNDSGTFVITGTDKTGVDFRSKGKLEYVDEHFLRWTTGEYFLKSGSNSPEVFLEYSEFDNTPRNVKRNYPPRTYSAHIPHWNPGDPTWQSGLGTGIIGAVNYLSSEGVNAHYFLTMSVYGDNDTVFPWLDIDSTYQYDVSKLDQWQIVFDHMMEKGIMVHFVLTEGENQALFEYVDGVPSFGDSRKIYYREMVARFGYLNAITWNIGEENGWNRTAPYGVANTTQQRLDFANYIKNLIYYDDHITVENGPTSNDNIFFGLLGINDFTGASIQGAYSNYSHGRARILNWTQQSAANGRKWVVTYDEPYTGGNVTPNLASIRKYVVWGTLTAGGAGSEFYVGGGNDFRLEDYTPYSDYWQALRIGRELFEDNAIPFYEMENNDDILSEGWCLQKEFEHYVIYLENGGTTNIDIAGEYSVKWYDPSTGGSLQDGTVTSISGGSSVNLGFAPNNVNSDWVIVLESIQTGPVPVTGVSLNSEDLTLGQGQTLTLSANTIPANADNKNLIWDSSNPSIVSVDPNGGISALNLGTAIITVTTEEGGFTDQITCTVVDSSQFCGAEGFIEMERYENVAGTSINNLITDVNYPDNPASTLVLNLFEIPVNSGNNYGARVHGYICAPETGEYYFWISGDDNVQLSLSTDDDPQNKSIIAFHNSWTSSREWNKFTSQKSQPVFLTIGQRYYIEALVNEASGGDNLAVGWRKPQDGNGLDPTEVIPGSVLSSIDYNPYVPVTGVAVTPTSQTLDIGNTLSLSAIISPVNATNTNLSWNSSDNSIATVSALGEVTAVSEGTVQITATTEDGNFSAFSTITVNPPVSGDYITGFTLINADTETDLLQLTDNLIVDFNTTSGLGLNIRVDTQGAVGSVVIQLSGPVNSNKTENVAPYALFGDAGGNYLGQPLPQGNYTLTSTAYSGANLSGSVLDTETISFSIDLPSYDIVSSAGTGGTISPDGTTSVDEGDDQAYDIIPDTGYLIEDVLVDGVSVGAVAQYTFVNVTANATISASFVLAPPTTYTITSSAGTGGTISPDGSTTIEEGNDQVYDILPDTGYLIEDVLVDGLSIGAVAQYTFANVTADATISASFVLAPPTTYTITSSAGTGGTISPDGSTTVEEGNDQVYDILPDTGYLIEDVLVDGLSIGAVAQYTFANVTADATISASFVLAPPATYTITSSAGTGGTISPDGSTTVEEGNDQVYDILPDTGYLIEDVLVDGLSIGAVAQYTFANVTADATISASFVLAPPITYTIVSSAGAGGSISPNGSVTVGEGDDQVYDITPDTGYLINDVLVDGVSVGAVAQYTFTNVNADATISASFILAPPVTYTIVSSAGTGGTISPNGSTTVDEGNDQVYDIIPDTGYIIEDVLVDGVSVGAVAQYTFTNVTADATISASFILAPPVTYTIVSSAGTGGTISPNGSTTVDEGNDQVYDIIPDTGYIIEDVLVDGLSIGAVAQYTFVSVTADATISASFSQISTGDGIVGFTLINANSDTDILSITNNLTINANSISGIGLNIRVDTQGTIGSVIIQLSGPVNTNKTENVAPYALFGDAGGNYLGQPLPQGNYTLSSTAYSGANLSGSVLDTETISFSIDDPSFTIVSSAGTGGSISPDGSTSVDEGDDQTYNIVPDTGYLIDDVLVDGISVGAVTQYTFNNVTSNATISASFVLAPPGIFTIVSSASTGGSISPMGSTTVNEGDDQLYNIIPDTGYQIADVRVDGVSVGALTQYTFTNVTADATIDALFSLIATGEGVISFTLVNGDTDIDLFEIINNLDIDLNTISGIGLNIRVNTQGSVGSVSIQLSGPVSNTRTENVAPYALFGDAGGNYAGQALFAGSYSLSATAYSGAGLSGSIVGSPLTIGFTITDNQANQRSNEGLATGLNSEKISVMVFPNSATTEVNLVVSSEASEIRVNNISIFDLNGRLIKNIDASQIRITDKEYLLSVLGIQEGTYMLRTVLSNGQVDLSKVIVRQ